MASSPLPTTVWVIMGNDYPDAVFSSEEDANKYVAIMRVEDRKDAPAPWPPGQYYRTFWRACGFTLDAQRKALK